MDLQDFKAFAEANDSATRPFKIIIYWLIAALFLFITLFGGAFFYFMHKAFNAETSSYLIQDVDRSHNITNNATIG